MEILPTEFASHDELIFYEDVPQEDLLGASRAVMRELRWKVVEESAGRIVAKVPISWRSRGEWFTVKAFDGEVQVRSRCRFQLFDARKNKDNVKLYLDRLDEKLDVEPVPSVRPQQ